MGQKFEAKGRVLSRELKEHIGKRVHVRGWLNNVRALGKINFVILRDRLGLIQIVLEDKELFRKISALQPGSVLRIDAEVVGSEQAPGGAELVRPEISIEVAVNEPPLIEYYKPELTADIDFILDHRPMALRHRKIQAVFKIQAEISHAYHLYMHDVVGAVEYFGPGMTGASSEGGAEFFNVDYFGYTATLAQSSQLYKQMMVGVNERVYALMPFFRAENSNTPRHLTEGKQFEFEMGFFDHWHEVLDVQEGAIKYIINYVRENCAAEVELLGNNLVIAPENVQFPRITFKEAQEIFFRRTGIDERAEPDLSPAAERELCAWAREERGTDFVFVIDWKTSKRPFYAYPNDENPELSNTFDLLGGGAEITSGGQRRHTYESMVQGILSKGMDPAAFTDYLSIFKYGMPPHGGFGLGLERLTMTSLQLKNIREASLFPSDPKRIAGNRIKAKIFFGDQNVRNEIIRQLKHAECEYKHLVHEATPTSEDSARVRGTPIESGVKSLVLRGKTSKKNIQVNIPSNLKLDTKAISDAAGEKFEFESPDVIKDRFGVGVGGVPPFGNLFNLETYYDERIRSLETVAFNCGLQTESIVMKGADLIQLVQPKFGSFAKD